MDIDGGNARQLSFHDEKVAFLRRSPIDDTLIWGIDAGGDERQQFWRLEPGGTPRPLTEAPQVIHDFGAWSADGARIAFAANDRDERFYDISLMDIASGARTRLLEGAGILTVPGWSPDMSRLIVLEDHSSSDTRPWIRGRHHRRDPRFTTPAPTRFASVRWVEKGAALMGISERADVMRLCRIDPETGEITVVYEAPGREVEAWSLAPDATLLATIENDRGYAILRVGPIGGERPEVAGCPAASLRTLPGRPTTPRWPSPPRAPPHPPASGCGAMAPPPRCRAKIRLPYPGSIRTG